MSAQAPLDGPYYDDFEIGMTIPPLPPTTLTEADNVWYRALTGDQHLAAADRRLYMSMSGSDGALINPGLVMQFAIGQTTNATRKAVANLYYRSMRILGTCEVGATIETTTKVLGLADSKPKGDQHRGKVWLGITSTADGEPIAAYERCALVNGRGPGPGHASEIPGPSEPEALESYIDQVPTWDVSALPVTEWAVGDEIADPMQDHIDMAPALARMTFNQAFIHRDESATVFGKRLVYGGHTQGLAQASLTRVLPGLATIVGWDGCDHLGPVFEGDLLAFRHRLLAVHPLEMGRLVRIEVRAKRAGEDDDLLVWTPIVFCA